MLLEPGAVWISCSRYGCRFPLTARTKRVAGLLKAASQAACGCLQMGTAEDVRAAEQTQVTLSCARGMKMHAVPRVASVKAGPTQPLSEDVLGSEE